MPQITQDVLLTVVRRIREFRCDAALSSWMHRITFNAAMSRLRRTRKRRQIECAQFHHYAVRDDPRLVSAEPVDGVPAADELLIRAELAAHIQRAMSAMPRGVKRCVAFRDLEGLSTRETGEVMRITPQTVKSRLRRGRRVLRRLLQKTI
jgi:RNA polymerase sigma-70 factor, ECF subfamily